MVRLLKTSAIIVVSIVLLLFLYPWILRGLGYYVDNTGGEIGRLAAEKGDVSLCKKIVVYSHFFGPTKMSRRGECVYTYAELTKDPSVCELLMPSSYGWSCLGAAEQPNARQCWFDFGPKPAEVGSGNGYATLPECASNPKSMEENRCCEMARILYIENEESCDTLTNSAILHDQCQELLAKRDRDIDECSLIRSDHIRTACEVAVRALLKK